MLPPLAIVQNIAWCPGNGCSNAFLAVRGPVKTVHCGGCGSKFCFKCSREAHEPIDCSMVRSIHRSYSNARVFYSQHCVFPSNAIPTI